MANNTNVSNDTKQERTVWAITRGIIGLVMVVFLGFIIFGDRSGCGIDKASIPCRWTGSILDIVGTIIFLASLVWLSGLADKITGKGLYSKYQGSEARKGGLYGVIGAAVGLLLIWF